MRYFWEDCERRKVEIHVLATKAMYVSFKYGRRISRYEYDVGAEKYNHHFTLLDDDSVADDEIRIDLDNPAFDKFYKYVEVFNKNKKFYSSLFYEELYCETGIIADKYASEELRLESKKNLSRLHELCIILKTEYGFELKS